MKRYAMEWEYKTVWVDETGRYSDRHHYNPGASSSTAQHRFDWKPLNELGAAGWELVSIAPLAGSISLPRIFVLDSAGRRRGCGSHNPIHGGDIDELLEPFPQYSHAGLAIALAALKAAQLRDPAHRLPQRRRHIRRDRDPLDTAVQALPFVVV